MRTPLLLAAASSIVLAVGCSGGDPAPPARTPSPALNILIRKLGPYEFLPQRTALRNRPPPPFTAVARHESGSPEFRLTFWDDPKAWEKEWADRISWRPRLFHTSGGVAVPDGISVRFVANLQTDWPMEQRDYPAIPPWRARASLSYLLEKNGALVVVTHRGPTHEVEPSDGLNREAWERSVLIEAGSDAGGNPALELLELMASERKVLATYRRISGRPRMRASVDGGDFAELHPGPSKAESAITFLLPARPGQAVKMEVTVPFVGYEVTTWGLVEDPECAECPGLLTVDGREVPLDREGRATVDFGTLTSPEWVRFETSVDRGPYDRSLVALLPRWGRPEEAWLDSLEFPLSPSPETPDLAAAERALAADLEAGFDPDRGAYVRERGEAWIARPGWGALGVLRRPPQLPLANAWTRMIMRSTVYSEREDGPLDLGKARELLANLTKSNPGPLRNGWGHPRQVFGLAVLWTWFPELHRDNLIESVLQGWVSRMGANPEPSTHGPGKSGIIREDSPVERAFAIAALDLGAKQFKNGTFHEARDLQLALLRGRVAKAGVFGEGEFKPRDAGTLEHVAAWGQLGAFLENEEALSEAQDFIVLMLRRGDKRARAAYDLYEEAPLGVRAGLLAVLRGRAGFLELPPTRR